MQASDLKQSLLQYLRGYLRRTHSAQPIEQRADWQALAQAELDRRAAAVLSALPDAELALVATGQVDLQQLARQAAAD
ncbi:hypothetical protein EBQ34_01340 [Vandammella animalimorsus]|uniref:Uncharacterized protein n=1 Tax=Vandammella animalimorsus TaxID=2029117 RepID=A0A3M6RUM4_9BURK|nr:hypothetical protein [Vandammella animalimorsus]RMX19026.1 hypothetical protein EBQ34_01340 [Vandammella animalimorsus]